MRIRLVPLEGGDPIELKKPLSIVGRREESDLCVPHKSISKQHCILVQTDGMIFIRDLGSTNGTRVNGQRVRRAALLPNDRLGFASVMYKVVFGDAAIDLGKTEQIRDEELAELRKMKDAPDEDRDRTQDEPALGPQIVPNPLPDII